MRFSGVYLPVTTPFEDGEVAVGQLAANITRYARRGVDGFLVMGSTGEAALVEEGEKLAVLRAARDAAGDRIVFAGVGLESTAGTVRLAKQAAAEGADAVLVLTPFYFRGRMTEDALVGHYQRVADASPLPVLLYNVPVYTGLVIPPRVVEKLAAHPNVAGLKDSAGDVGWLLDVLARVPADFEVLCGSASVFLPALEAGACGGILAAADVLPEAFVRLFRLHRDGRRREALELQKALGAAARAIVGAHGVAGVKAAIEARGLAGGDPRLPLLPLSEVTRAEVRRVIEALVTDGVIDSVEI